MFNHSTRITDIAQAVLSGHQIDRTEAVFLLQLGRNEIYDLFYWANRIRLNCLGEEISLCSIASVKTGRCGEDCRFCAQSSYYHSPIETKSMDRDQLLAAAENAIACGAHCFGLVSSGRGPSDDQIEEIAPVITKITQSSRIQCCASLGCLTPRQAQRLYNLGVSRYNHNLETSRRFFSQVVSTHNYDDRAATVRNVRRVGMEICCGGIIGLGETPEDRVDLAIALRDLDVDSVPLNFLHPIPGTPFAHNQPVSPLTALQTIAMFRFVLPNKQIKIAGGRENCLRNLQSWMFFAGASSTMIGNYLTTNGRPADQDLQMLNDLDIPLKSAPHLQPL